MRILGIETSCDETGLAIVERRKEQKNIISSALASQVEIHQEYGGVFPTLAVREHKKNLLPLLKKVLKEANDLKKTRGEKRRKKEQEVREILKREPLLLKATLIFLKKHKKPEVDGIAVTVGPGLEPCLFAGVNFAKALASYWDLPIIPVDHMEAHILVNFLEKKSIDIYPAVALLVSGGHTQLVLMKEVGGYKLLGETRDDAAGECFDKTARILGLPYPGGPAISKEAQKIKDEKTKFEIKLPRPMINSGNYDFSFSGLKTAVLYKVKETPEEIRESEQFIQEMSAEIEEAITDVLTEKTIKAAKDFNARAIILGGGVSANKRLKEKIKEEKLPKTSLFFPPPPLATDNGIMTAFVGIINFDERTNWKNIKVDAKLKIDKSK